MQESNNNQAKGKTMKDNEGRFTATHTSYYVGCLAPKLCRNGKHRLTWNDNAISAETVGELLASAKHFADVVKWRVTGRFIYESGAVSGHSLPVARRERDIIARALLAASTH